MAASRPNCARIQRPPFTPYPNRAKSPFSGSLGNTSDKAAVSLRAELMDATDPFISPSLTDCRTTCVSNGITSVRRSIESDHNPISTGEPSRTIQRRNMHTRLQADCAFFGTTPSDPAAAK